MREHTREERQFADAYGRQLQRDREALNWRVEDVASRVGVHRNTVLHWESGEHMPNVYHHALLQRALRRGRHQAERQRAA